MVAVITAELEGQQGDHGCSTPKKKWMNPVPVRSPPRRQPFGQLGRLTWRAAGTRYAEGIVSMRCAGTANAEG